MFDNNPFRRLVGHRIIAHIRKDTWRGRVDAYRDGWLTISGAEYVDEHGTLPADGSIMLPESCIDWMQIVDEEESQ